MKTIEHDSNEPPRRAMGWIWWPAWAMVALLWVGQGFFDGFDWNNLSLGIGTGALLAAWSVDMAIRAGRAKDL